MKIPIGANRSNRNFHLVESCNPCLIVFGFDLAYLCFTAAPTFDFGLIEGWRKCRPH